MTEFLQNIRAAWLGWKHYTDGGKLAALLLAVLLFLWCSNRKKAQKLPFLLYTSVMAICCILPLTAALLMVYQTRFYAYEWIWSLVPVTAAAAYGITQFLAERWGDFKAARWREGIPVTVLLLAVLLLSGGLGGQFLGWEAEGAERKRADAVLGQLLEWCPDGDICLWAPREIMEYARERDSHIRLPYGRNMWDLSLNGYAYDTYDENMMGLYRWMERIGDGTGDDVGSSLEACAGNARNAGVDCILLPGDADPEIVRRMEEALGMSARPLEGYWVFYGRTD